MRKYKMLSLSAQKEFLLNSMPVTVLTGNEFAKKDGATLIQQVTEYYNSIGNKALSPVYGEIILDKQSVEDDFAHGIGRKKAIAFAAVPSVVEKGIIILPLKRHKKNEKTLSAMIAAPIVIGIEEFICVILIRQYASGNKKLYVHEVSLKQKLLDSSSSPALIPATNQGVMCYSSIDSSNPINQGSIAKVLQKIILTKH
jgi:hypothetical protein